MDKPVEGKAAAAIPEMRPVEEDTWRNLDRLYHAWLGRMTLSLSPAAIALAWMDWLAHLSVSPGKQLLVVQKALRKALRVALYGSRHALDPETPLCIEPLPQDSRFRDPAWRKPPFNYIQQTFLNYQQWLHNLTTGVRGVQPRHEEIVTFMTRQWLDAFSPSNFPWTNPVVLRATLREKGMNFIRGYTNWLEDLERRLGNRPPVGAEKFRVGKEVAVTPGKVVYRNRLIELIQYAPATDKVHAEPLLIIPAWIMKYYILDLSPQNSLVRYLVEQGHTVFMISWKNPTAEDRDLSFDDYRRLGVMAALEVIGDILPGRKVHALGYCLGGTLLSIAAATMARDDDDRLRSITLLATQTDFTEVGEIGLFITPSQLTWLEDVMWSQGYLDTTQMSGAFSMLRSSDLIWSAMVQEYLLGERRPLIDLMAWNADGTRLPYRMHTEYLEHLYLNNDLAEGRYEVEGRAVSLGDITAPMFVVGTTRDHVAPWRSVYKIHQLARRAEVTFLLTSGGHNAGIISEPGHPHREHWIHTRKVEDKYVEPELWQALAEHREGSWWPSWQAWLAGRSSGMSKPPAMGSRKFPSLEDAPGSYVLQH